MKKIDKLYKKEFDKVDISTKDKNRIYNNIVSTKRNNYYVFRKLAIICSVLVFVSFIGIAYAEEIGKIFNELFSNKTVEVNPDGEKLTMEEIIYKTKDNLKQDISFEDPSSCNGIYDQYYVHEGQTTDDDCYKLYSYEEIEKELNIKILKSELFKKDKLTLDTLYKENNKITFLSFKGKKMYNDYPVRKDINEHFNIETPDSDKYPIVNFNIYLLDKDNKDNGELVINKAPDYDVSEYTNDNLNINGIKVSHEKDYVALYFTYDNVLYLISVDTFHLDNLDATKELDKIVESLK